MEEKELDSSNFTFRTTKKQFKASFRTLTLHLLEEIAVQIKNGKYREALDIFYDTMDRSEDVSRIGFFLEMHLINHITTENGEKNIFKALYKHKASYLKMLEKLKMQQYTLEDTKSLGPFLFPENFSLEEKRKFVIEKIPRLSKEFYNFTIFQKCLYVKQIMDLTIESTQEFLKKHFNLEVYQFLLDYYRDKCLFGFIIDKSKYNFMTESSYYENCNFYELIALYKFTEKFDIFLKALHMNANMEQNIIKSAFKKHMPGPMTPNVKKIVIRAIESAYIPYLYKRAIKEDFLSLTAKRRRCAEKNIKCAFIKSGLQLKKRTGNQ
ncbi:hypothetical protein M153_3160008103 [Pseudoloma neurophilia]|uniref:Uncharacterized protein n=1 Tax=Pseudoloma neurophilia TaxID=146866 RepID=A0A0R0LYA3_9MICR|nr:hypothetical protein M153_3160008103 [Pseudoloma neurophilia]